MRNLISGFMSIVNSLFKRKNNNQHTSNSRFLDFVVYSEGFRVEAVKGGDDGASGIIIEDDVIN
ncbi:MAG: hypothetical protein R2828_12120 [Saprospiraceae bacterium]